MNISYLSIVIELIMSILLKVTLQKFFNVIFFGSKGSVSDVGAMIEKYSPEEK